jgi:hypothetical protein
VTTIKSISALGMSALASAALLGTPGAVRAAPVTALDDTFTDGGVGNGADSLDTAWFHAKGTSAVTLAVVDDSAGLGTGNALQLNNTGSNNRPIVGQFSPQTLSDGDSIVLNFDFRVVSSSQTAPDRPIRFGLYNDAGTWTTGNKGSTDVTYDDDLGYLGRIDYGSATGNTMDLTRDDSATGIIGGTQTSIGVSTANTADRVTDALAHHMVMTLTRNGTSLNVSLKFDNQTAITGTDATPVGFTFNEVMLMTSSAAALDLRFDNVNVQYVAAVPEPASSGLLVLAGGFGLRRRRR